MPAALATAKVACANHSNDADDFAEKRRTCFRLRNIVR